MFDMYNINQVARETPSEYFDYYTIQKGDNLFQIAKNYDINPDLLAILNGLEPNEYIYPNQVIMIPKKEYAYYITRDGDSLSTVATTFNTSISNLLKYNPTIYLREGQLIVNKISM